MARLYHRLVQHREAWLSLAPLGLLILLGGLGIAVASPTLLVIAAGLGIAALFVRDHLERRRAWKR